MSLIDRGNDLDKKASGFCAPFIKTSIKICNPFPIEETSEFQGNLT